MRALPPGQAGLWGRLLLQAAGSSPSAWLDALDKFPDRQLAGRWKTRAPLTQSWERKIAVLPPLTQTPGGLVIFSHFLGTQTTLAKAFPRRQLRHCVLTVQVHAPDRQ